MFLNYGVPEKVAFLGCERRNELEKISRREIVFGPVPSRRLGKSLGVNHIPPKACSYSCVYCQIGRTRNMGIKRREFFLTDEIVRQIEEKIGKLRADGISADYISFVPDGEPTLDIRLGDHIRALKSFGIKIAVITNGSLLWMDEVRKDLMQADWVSVKVDTAEDRIWKQVDRPHGKLDFGKVTKGILDFAKDYSGTLVTETMIVRALNDQKESIIALADYLKEVKPSRAYLLVPTRPPAEVSAAAPEPLIVQTACSIMKQRGIQAECITGAEEGTFYFSDDFANDLLSILAVHPIREDVLKKQLEERKIAWTVVEDLIKNKLLGVYNFEGNRFYKKNI